MPGAHPLRNELNPNLNRGLQTVRFWPPTKFADLALHLRLIALFEDANKLLEKVKIEFQFNKKIL